MVDRDRIEEQIRQIAYEIFVNSGCIPGRDLDNWLQAERIVLERYGLNKREESHLESEVENKKTRKREGKSKTSNRASSAKKGKAKSPRKK